MKQKKSTHPDTDNRKDRIIRTALSIFTEKGFTETSIADICRASGASTGSVYHHFKSKGVLAASIYIEGIRDYQGGLLEVLKQKPNARKGITAIVTYHLTWVSENPEWARFLFQKRHADFMGDVEQAMNTLNVEFAKGLTDWFRARVSEGELKLLPRDVMIALILGPCQEFARMLIAGHTVSGLDQAARTIAEGVWNSVGVHP
jgi:AcrR family transcriptional regulator